MSSPRLGVVRESMLTNPLHIKAPLGQSRSRGLTVPGPDFTFGTSSSSLKHGGVAEVLSSWKVPSRPEGSVVRLDFVSLNRDAVRSGLVTSKEISQYRAQRGGPSIQSPAPRCCEGGASRHPAPVPDMTFGVRNRPSSPLSDLLSHQYGRSWLDEQLSRNQNSTTHQVKPGGAAETRTTLMRRSRALPVTHSPVQLSQFTQVSPALDTFRDPAARVRAFRLSGGTGRPAEHQGTDRTEPRTGEPLSTNKE
ncbi:cilia- and flagella-associated protein 77 [Acanthochromis polyacanthus]|uniref:cilia- and flagella-associated protein 77 n=1 Tax=Acanthochromis polyacanthus TaxID=80966 RepID=UPI00223447B6|nr:cilia- and flagella-associated protein 77 [Acanthochromis polyacanthus]